MITTTSLVAICPHMVITILLTTFFKLYVTPLNNLYFEKKSPLSNSCWTEYGKVGVATRGDDNKPWNKFIMLTDPRESVTTCQAGLQDTAPSGQETEDRSEHKV